MRSVRGQVVRVVSTGALLVGVVGGAVLVTPSVAGAASSTGSFTSLAPARLLDTRVGVGAPEAAVAAGAAVHLQVDGAGGVPATGVSAVVLNVTETQATSAGYITVYPDGVTQPLASNLNFVAGQTVPNLVVAPVGADGKVDLYNGSAGTVELLADVSGYFSSGQSPATGTFTSLTPDRLLDTRVGTGAPAAPVAGGASVHLQVDGTGGVPATDVAAVVLNVTTTQATAPGYITVYPDGQTKPLASNLNFVAGDTVPNLVIAPVGADGKVDLYNGSSGSSQLIADVSGYFTGSVTSGLARALTSGGTAAPAPRASAAQLPSAGVSAAVAVPHANGAAAPVAAYGKLSLQVEGVGNVPASGVSAVVLNVTVTSPTAPAGYITVYPDGATKPLASNLNFVAGETVPNLVIAPVGADGDVDLYNGSSGSVQLIADVSGYFLTASGPFAPVAPSRVLDTRDGTGTGGGTVPPPQPGSISGTVTDASSTDLSGVVVDAFSGTGVEEGTATTSASGTYTLTNLAAGTYDVCFDARGASGGASTTGYADQCYQGAGWDGLAPDISGATPVTVTAGATTPGIGAALAAGGAISGTVTSSTASPLAGVSVDIYTAAGGFHATATTGADGTYSVSGLTPGSYDVCFDGSAVGNSDQCYQGVAWNGSAANISGATPVAVTGGTTASSIDATLTSGGGVTGTVTDAASHPLSDVEVHVLTTAGAQAGSAYTATDGTYSVGGLASGTYHVCFDASAATGGTSTTGYPDQCYNGVAWDGSSADAGSATAVAVAAGSTTPGIGAALAVGGAISGTVTDPSSQPLAGVVVEVDSTSTGGYVQTATTDAQGHYTVVGLPAGTQTACFDASAATGGSSSQGYLDQCFKAVSWDGRTNEVVAGATGISVQAAATTTGIDASLVPAGEISGTVSDSGSNGLAGVDVEVFAASGAFVTSGYTGQDGTYVVAGLTPGSYDVCFDGSAGDGTSATGYLSQCFDGVAWAGFNSPVPAGSTLVVVGGGATHSGIDASLAPGGAISGTVTDAASHPLQSVEVEAFTGASTQAAVAFTASDGTYTLTGLATGTYDVCFAGAYATGGSSTTGYADQCYDNVPWSSGSFAPAGGSTSVDVTAGSTTPGIDDSLVTGSGTISGTVTDTGSSGLSGVAVEVLTTTGGFVAEATTAPDGTYSVTGLQAGSYDVCFDAQNASGGSSSTGYADECYKSQPWSQFATPPTASTVVAISGSASITGIDQALPAAGALSGTVTDAGSTPLNDVEVEVYAASNAYSAVASTSTGANGAFTVSGLDPGTYDVCFNPYEATGGSSLTGYLSQCYNGVAWAANAGVPSGVTAVTVASGSAVAGVDVSLAASGGISGTVTDTGSHPLGGVLVEAFTSSDSFASSTTTASDGTYSLTGLPAGFYDVCFATTTATGGTSTTGYSNQCYLNLPWSNSYGSLPAGVSPVDVSAGSMTTGIGDSIVAAGAISGTVTDAGSHPLSGVSVVVETPAGIAVATATTASDGTYSVHGVAAGSYRVCFTASDVSGGTSTTGYLDQCYAGVAWNGNYPLPSGTTGVTVTPGATTSGISASLGVAGAVSGTVTDGGSHALGQVYVVVYSGGQEVGTTVSAADGTYAVTGLPTGSYDVCFELQSATGGSSTLGYLDQCYKNVAWAGPYSQLFGGGPAAGSTAVAVTDGVTTPGINAVAVPAGAISGKVTDAGSQPVANVQAEVLTTTGTYVTGATTGADGTYSVGGLTAGTYHVCFGAPGASGGGSTTGYLDQCNSGVAWDGVSGDVPAGAAVITVTSGATTTGIGAALAPAGAVSGTVTDSGSHPLADVSVEVETGNGTDEGTVLTTVGGTYKVVGLTAGTYYACFSEGSASGGSSTTGYLAKCSAGFAVTDGATTGGINASLGAAGGISGTVTGTNSTPLGGVVVEVLDAGGVYVNSVSTGADGTYAVNGLSAGTYDVCFSTYALSGSGYANQCYKNIPWSSSGTVPAGVTGVTVAAGTVATGVNATLVANGEISGTVTDGSSHRLAGVGVEVTDSSGNQVAYASTASDGTYTVTRVPAGSYSVCFSAAQATGGTSTTGYASQCDSGVGWDGGGPVPAGATKVAVAAGATVPGVNATLSAGGQISGTVTDAASHGLADVQVQVSDASGDDVAYASTASDGTYTVSGLTPGSYDVCFAATTVTGGSATGYASQCSKGIAWVGSGPVPGGVTAVNVSAGATATGVNATLAAGGEITGTVTGPGAVPVAGAYVEVFTTAGAWVTGTATAANGTYAITGVSPGTYDVCFAGFFSNLGSQCYSGVAWDAVVGLDFLESPFWTGKVSLPAGATGVAVTSGATKSSINAALPAGGTITGTVTDTGAHNLDGVSVEVLDSGGNLVNEVRTGPSGQYSVGGLTAGTYDVCFDAIGAIGGSSTTGYADQCYSNVAWNGNPAVVTGATGVAVTAGGTRSGIGAALKAQ